MSLGAATDPDNAVGTQLDRLYSLLDILRQIATRSRVTATVTGEAGTGLSSQVPAPRPPTAQSSAPSPLPCLPRRPASWWKWKR